jgi:hypothetical protein
MEAHLSVAPSDLNLTKNSTTLGPAARTSAGTAIVAIEVLESFSESIRRVSQEGDSRVAGLAQQPANGVCVVAMVYAQRLGLVAYLAPTSISGLETLECC